MLLGADRNDHLATMAAWFNAASTNRQPLLLCVTGAPGLGKTRLVQELYRHLAGHQPSPRYWPLEFSPPGHLSVMAARKLVAPAGAFHVPAGAELKYFWWGISCQRDQTGIPMQAVRSAAGQFEAHLRHAAEEAAHRDQRWQRWADNLAMCVDIVGLADPLALIPNAAKVASNTMRVAGDRRRRHEEVRRDRSIDASAPEFEQADELAEAITLLARGGLPTVIAVDDAHWADPTMVRLLNDLMQRADAPILILATAWDHEVDRQFERNEHGSFGCWVRSLSSPSVAGWQLRPLAASDLGVMIKHAAPETPDDRVLAIAEKASGNPLGMELILQLQVVRDDIADDNEINMDPEQLRALPADLRSLYQQLWTELGGNVQRVLVLASLQGRTFLPGAALAMARTLGLRDTARGLEEAEKSLRWISIDDSGVGSFVEGFRWQIASDEQANTFLDEDLHRARSAALAFVRTARSEPGWLTQSAAMRRRALALVVELSDEGLEIDRGELLDIATELLEHTPETDAPSRVPLLRLVVELTGADQAAVISEVADSNLAVAESDGPSAGELDEPDVRAAEAAAELAELEPVGASVVERGGPLMGDLDGTPAAYIEWDGTLDDLTTWGLSDLAELVGQVVDVEGPVTVGRVMRRLVDNSELSRLTPKVRTTLERGITAALRQGLVVRCAGDRRDDGDRRCIRTPRQLEGRLRERGPRSLDELPRTELVALGESLAADGAGIEEIALAVRTALGISRRSDKTDRYVEEALRGVRSRAGGGRPEAGFSIEKVLDAIDDQESAQVLGEIIDCVDLLDLAIRPFAASFAIVSYEDKRRSLATFTPTVAGWVQLGYRPEQWEHLLPVTATQVEEALGDNWYEWEPDDVRLFFHAIVDLVLDAWNEYAAQNSYVVVATVVDHGRPVLNQVYWYDDEADAVDTCQWLIDIFSGDERSPVGAVHLVDVADGFEGARLLQVQTLGSTPEARDTWESTLGTRGALCMLTWLNDELNPTAVPLMSNETVDLRPSPAGAGPESEVAGWTVSRARELQRRLLAANRAVQAQTIGAEARNGGVCPREEVYRIGRFDPSRSLKGFTRPVARMMRQMVEEGLLPDDAVDPMTPMYDDSASFQRAKGFFMPAEIVPVFDAAFSEWDGAFALAGEPDRSTEQLAILPESD